MSAAASLLMGTVAALALFFGGAAKAALNREGNLPAWPHGGLTLQAVERASGILWLYASMWPRPFLRPACGGRNLRLRGHMQYFGINYNQRYLLRLMHQVERLWHKWLNRRSQRKRMSWDGLERSRSTSSCARDAGAACGFWRSSPIRTPSSASCNTSACPLNAFKALAVDQYVAARNLLATIRRRTDCEYLAATVSGRAVDAGHDKVSEVTEEEVAAGRPTSGRKLSVAGAVISGVLKNRRETFFNPFFWSSHCPGV